jgi:hypothetical protein
MKRHPIDTLSAAIGVVVIIVAIAVMLRSAGELVSGGPWWLALAALVLGLGLIPWRPQAE